MLSLSHFSDSCLSIIFIVATSDAGLFKATIASSNPVGFQVIVVLTQANPA
jgi:hypothetical protein